MNFDPTPGSDSTFMSPPKDYIIIFDIVNPSPMPPLLISLVFANVPKNLKSCAKSF